MVPTQTCFAAALTIIILRPDTGEDDDGKENV